ncbi:hypothetical protein MIMGU_mgv1a013723mg [Erythranthe guttata]|uniref:UspA domain-containing protein n=1 Tax=Erythranthe guttata TaxID=4155 RepID=A0A022Q7F1_ERYGU|nr:PREDICTED: uncharacterized protein LOC105973051 [Erythranthe guttata]EYU23891.1 hypothetical protein MIMGU_mgv1a013723mg [Erythranthe guttata]|eukprot:XP_012853504.1 PREDICTED: uncharacterized protein LOC105973051 [Erythranthe guttata]
MGSSDSSFMRQIISRKTTSKRWGGGGGGGGGGVEMEEEENMMYYGGGGGMLMMMKKKRVMVAVDEKTQSKQAMMWALTHVTNKGDILTLLHILSPSSSHNSSSPYLATSLGSLCKASKPEVEVEALVIQGPKLATVMSQVKKLDVSVLVLAQKNNPSSSLHCLCFKSSSTEEFVEECINRVECLTIGVKKQSNGVGGYLISTRWHKNFWLLA